MQLIDRLRVTFSSKWDHNHYGLLPLRNEQSLLIKEPLRIFVKLVKTDVPPFALMIITDSSFFYVLGRNFYR